MCQVQNDAICAAIDNLKDSFQTTSKTYLNLKVIRCSQVIQSKMKLAGLNLIPQYVAKSQGDLLNQLSVQRLLLSNFTSSLEQLASVKLDSGLIETIEKDGNMNETRQVHLFTFNLLGIFNFFCLFVVAFRTLLDCIPVEKEKAFYAQCEDIFTKVCFSLICRINYRVQTN